MGGIIVPMSLEYKEILISGYVNTTDKFGLLVGYSVYLNQPLLSGANSAQIVVYDQSGNRVNEVGVLIGDNGLTQTYVQLNVSNANPKPLLIPPGCSIGIEAGNGVVAPYGMLLLGTLDEIARVAIR
jgi:hypothetical protein